MSEKLEIKRAGKEMSKLVISLAGTSGGGKTRSALELAYGMVDCDPSKIGLLDAENRRGALYCDLFKGRKDLKGDHRFLIADLIPPFSPSRYISAMRQFCDEGIEVLIIDSTSHEVEGEGGLEDIAHSPKADGTERKIADWITAKREHKKFVNALLFLPVHVICCVRAREKMDFKNTGPKGEPTSMGIQPIAEKNFLFEMTFSVLLSEQGKKRDAIKMNSDFEPLIGTSGYFTAEHGKALRDWLGGFDPMEQAKGTLRLAASNGMEALKQAWALLDKPKQKSLEKFKDTLKDLAEHADLESTTTPEDRPDINW